MTKNNEKRKLKYPDTDTFTYVNVNPKNKITGDCVIRALANAFNRTWDDVLTELFYIGLDICEEPIADAVVKCFLKKHGAVKCKEPRDGDNKRITGEDFCKFFAREDTTYIMNLGTHHMACIKDCKVNDIWYSQYEFCHSYWEIN